MLVLTRPDRLDEVTVRVEARPAADPDTRADAARSLQHRIKTNLGVTMDVDVVDPGGVERSTGKARRVLDER